jgi:predicted Zn-dependent protease
VSARTAGTPLGVPALALAVAALLAACGDGTKPNTCYDSNAFSYGFRPQADTTIVFRWPADRMPVRFYADTTSGLRANVLAGITAWVNAYHCNEASFALVQDSTTADVIVRQAPLLPPAGAAMTLHADSVGACIGRTDFQIDSTHTLVGPFRAWVVPMAAADPTALAGCYRMVTTHEIGHTLGIFRHSPDPDDLMYPTPRRGTLSPDDRYTLQRLYHTTPNVLPAARTR